MTNIQHLKTARIFAKMMDNQFSFLGIGFGIDAIIGIVPGIGDLFGMMLSGYLVWIGYEMKVPTEKLIQMISNVLIDGFMGSVPFIGDVADVFFKANMRNLRILEEFAGRPDGQVVVEGEVIS